MKANTLAHRPDDPTPTEAWLREDPAPIVSTPRTSSGVGASPAGEPAADLSALHAKVDRLTAAVEKLDRRREELEELVEDLLPAVNGAVLLARDRLDRLERSGAWANGNGALQAAETALTVVDPEDLEALALSLPELLRTARLLTSPEITELAPRFLEAVHEAHHGPAPTLRSLLRSARAPRTRRGMQVALALLQALGAGTGAPAAALPAPARRPATPAPASRRGPAPAACATPAGAPRELRVGDRTLVLDPDGNLHDPAEWDRGVAEAFAAQAGLTLTDAHWSVLDFVRKDGAASGAAPGMRRIVAETGVSQKDLYRLFPGGPGVLAARLAGLKKPKSCV